MFVCLWVVVVLSFQGKLLTGTEVTMNSEKPPKGRFLGNLGERDDSDFRILDIPDLPLKTLLIFIILTVASPFRRF